MPPVEVFQGDCREVMAGMPESSVDAVITDPPYGLEFMSKEWDRLAGDWGREGDTQLWKVRPKGGTDPFQKDRPRYHAGPSMQAWHEQWAREAYRVLRPGGHILAFGGTRTFHRLTCAIEDAGFEIRDCLSWLYGSGFPKSLDVSKAIDKAAGVEREVVGRYQPPNGSDWRLQADNSHPGDGGTMGQFGLRSESMQITAPATDAAKEWAGFGTALKPAWEPIILARKPLSEPTVVANVLRHGTGAINVDGCRIEANGRPLRENAGGTELANAFGAGKFGSRAIGSTDLGRWPANVCLDEESAALLDQQSGESTSTNNLRHNKARAEVFFGQTDTCDRITSGHNDTGGASRFFYTAKASTSERNERVRQNGSTNTHPTVKPVDLMRWLCRLVTPPGGLILDPFCGSGTTLVAAMQEGFRSIGIEQSEEYVKIASARLDGVQMGF